MHRARSGFALIAVVALASSLAARQAPAKAALTDEEFLKGTVSLKTQGIVLPVAKEQVAPKYTVDAMRAKIQGTVKVELVVLADGTVGRARVTQSLDKVTGLDEAALAAAMHYTFTPATVRGEPVSVVIVLELQFKLH